MKEIHEMKGAGRSIRGIAGELAIARNTVRRYLNTPLGPLLTRVTPGAAVASATGTLRLPFRSCIF